MGIIVIFIFGNLRHGKEYCILKKKKLLKQCQKEVIYEYIFAFAGCLSGFLGWWWVVVNIFWLMVDGGRSWWLVVDIFWLVVGGGGCYCVVVGDGGYILAGGLWWVVA